MSESAAASLTCPRCGAIDQVQSVPSIVATGSSHGTVRGTTGFVGLGTGVFGGVGQSAFSTQNRSQLASMFTLPMPARADWSYFKLVLFDVFTLGLAVACFSEVPSSGSAATFIVIGCIAIAAALGITVGVRAEHRTYRRETRSYALAYPLWEQLTYCHRCNLAILPGTAWFGPPERAREALYERTASDDQRRITAEAPSHR